MVTYRHLSIRHYFLREETFNLQEKNAVRAIEFEVKPHDENAKTNEVLKQWLPPQHVHRLQHRAELHREHELPIADVATKVEGIVER